MKISVSKLDKDAVLPTVKHLGDAGMDFYSLEDYIIPDQSFMIAKTGIKVKLPEGYVGLLWPKGKNNHLLGAGVIEYTYGGEILFKVVNYLDHDLVIRYGDAIGQMIIVANVSPEPVEEEFELKTARGSTGGIVTQLDTITTPVDGSTIEEILYPQLFGKTWD